MKVAAHPMLVAVALGLLGPSALAADPKEEKRDVRRATAKTDLASSDLVDALEDAEAPYWTQLTLVDVDGDDEAASWRGDRDLTV